MSPDDITEFTELLDGTCALLTGGKYSPNDSSTTIFFCTLAGFPMADVRAGFAEHVRRSRFSPTPNDILELLSTNDGRPGPEEAWAIAACAADEEATVVWTQEMRDAFALARPVMQLGDEVGARMAFKEAYTRLVGQARQHGLPCQWAVTEGHDAELRRVAVERALALGRRLDASEHAHILALPARSEPVALLAAPAEVMDEREARARAKLPELRNLLLGVAPAASADATAKQQTANARQVTAERVQAYAAEHGLVMDRLPMPVRAAVAGEWHEPAGVQV
jgi:hypothetical protein